VESAFAPILVDTIVMIGIGFVTLLEIPPVLV